jgi:DNA-binding NtrC family response regulator
MLFGHRRGAFTTAVESVPGILEQAEGGTLFLDELASLSLEVQAALLRVLETSEVRRYGDVGARRVSIRLIGAVNGEVSALVASGCFRGDLYHRLAAGVITLPALRDRPEDVWPLAKHFARLEQRTLALGSRGVIERYPWPGNARELGHVIGRAASLEQGNVLCPAVLAEAIDLGRLARLVKAGQQGGRPSRPPEERKQLEETCRLYRGRVPLIAAALGVSRATLYRRLASHGLRVESFRHGEEPACRLTVS